jgi:hypothetical protein
MPGPEEIKYIERVLQNPDGSETPVKRTVPSDYEISPIGGEENGTPYTERPWKRDWDAEQDEQNRMSDWRENLASQYADQASDPSVKPYYEEFERHNRDRVNTNLRAERIEFENPNDPIAARRASGLRGQTENEIMMQRELMARRYRGYTYTPEEEQRMIDEAGRFGKRYGSKMALPGGRARAETILPQKFTYDERGNPIETPEDKIERKRQEQIRLWQRKDALPYYEGRSPESRSNPRLYNAGQFGIRPDAPHIDPYDRSWNYKDFMTTEPNLEDRTLDVNKFVSAVPNAERFLAPYYNTTGSGEEATREFSQEAFKRSPNYPYNAPPPPPPAPPVPPVRPEAGIEPFEEPIAARPKTLAPVPKFHSGAIYPRVNLELRNALVSELVQLYRQQQNMQLDTGQKLSSPQEWDRLRREASRINARILQITEDMRKLGIGM